MKFKNTALTLCLLACATTQAHAQAPSALQARSLAASCAACHGTHGQAQPGMATLAGLPQEVIVQKMLDYKAGRLPATLMHQLAKGYTDEEITAIAAQLATPKK
jgi:sulfide dehydrogenase cytochrome subunit